MDPLQWMSAVRMRVQAADKNIEIIYMVCTTIFNFNPVHNIAFSCEKNILFKAVLNKNVGGFWCERTTKDGLFLWKRVMLWTMGSYFDQKRWLKLKRFDEFVSYKHAQDINGWTGVIWITCGLLWCFCQLFGLLLGRHPFTALVSKCCNFFKSVV